MWKEEEVRLRSSVMESDDLRRLRILAGLIIFTALIFVVRLFVLQVISGNAYREEANRQYVSAGDAAFDRGSIYFSERRGTLVSAATVKPSYFVSLNPIKISEPRKLYALLAPHIGSVSEADFLSHFKNDDDPYEVIAKGLSEEEAGMVKELKLSEVEIHRNQERDYPAGTLAAQVLGFVGQTKESGDRLIGQAGVERYYDGLLSRKEVKLYVNFFAQLFGDINRALFERADLREGNVVLTIEPSVEGQLENVLKTTMAEYRGKEVGGIIIEPKTGAILAMASLPSFNPRDFRTSDPNTFRNPLVQSVYELGSIVKPLTLAAAMDAGAITAETTYTDEGYIKIDDATIKNYDGKGRGLVSMQEVLNQSLNTGAVFAVQQLGEKRFQRYFHNYGFGESTGIDLPGEEIGLVETIDSGRSVEMATAAFGQGFAVTPLSMARALASLGNGGLIVRPRIVKEIRYALMAPEKREPIVERRVIDERTSLAITRMLVNVVDTALAGGKAKMTHFTIAAKTGTAQIPKQGGGYYTDRYLHSFFGYAPAFDPRFLVFLYIREPQGVRYASETLTRPFMDTMKFLLHYYEVPPDR